MKGTHPRFLRPNFVILDDDDRFSFFDRQGADSLVRSFVRPGFSHLLSSLSLEHSRERGPLSTLKIFFFCTLSSLLSLSPGKKALRVYSVFAHVKAH